jgi:uncharacterized membrane protein (DUF373 family)
MMEKKNIPSEKSGGLSMLDFVKKFVQVIVYGLTIMLAIVLLVSAVELGYKLISEILAPSTPEAPKLIIHMDKILEVFGLFLLVLIGIELLETMKTFIIAQETRLQVVFMVALIAIARKVIVLDLLHIKGMVLIGLGAVIISLSVGFFLIKRLSLHQKMGLLKMEDKQEK